MAAMQWGYSLKDLQKFGTQGNESDAGQPLISLFPQGQMLQVLPQAACNTQLLHFGASRNVVFRQRICLRRPLNTGLHL